MGISVKNVTATVDFVRTTITIPIDAVDITAIAALPLGTTEGPTAIFAELGIMAGGTNLENRAIILASGYIGDSAGISWTGKLAGLPEQYAYLSIWSSTANNARLALHSLAKEPK